MTVHEVPGSWYSFTTMLLTYYYYLLCNCIQPRGGWWLEREAHFKQCGCACRSAFWQGLSRFFPLWVGLHFTDSYRAVE